MPELARAFHENRRASTAERHIAERHIAERRIAERRAHRRARAAPRLVAATA